MLSINSRLAFVLMMECNNGNGNGVLTIGISMHMLLTGSVFDFFWSPVKMLALRVESLILYDTCTCISASRFRCTSLHGAAPWNENWWGTEAASSSPQKKPLRAQTIFSRLAWVLLNLKKGLELWGFKESVADPCVCVFIKSYRNQERCSNANRLERN